MYLKHFGLERPPFKITPDTSLFYEGGNRGAALEAVKYSILQGEGIIKVVGEVGSGKTMLCRMLEIRLPKYVDIIYLANPSLSPEKILHVIAMEMKLDVDQSDDKSKVMQVLQDHLLDIHSKGRQAVVFIEEAQGMPLETLEEIRLLSNLETDHFKMLQIVLFGQPELDENLAKREIRQLKERISHHLSLDIFEKKDIQSYLNFRLRAAGFKGADLFSTRHASVIAKYSRGLTRRINILADKTLLAAFADDNELITPKYIKRAAKDSQYVSSGLTDWIKYSMAASLVVLLLAAGWFLRGVGEKTALLDNSQVNNDENVASVGNKSNFSSLNDGENEFQRLESGNNSQLLNARLKETSLWLQNKSDYRYSVQLMLLDQSQMKTLNTFLLEMKNRDLIDNTFVYQVSKNGQLFFGVMYGRFRQYSNAIQSMNNVRKLVKVKKPFIREMENISSEYS